ncbi:MAG: hypothetical protein AAGB31_08185 [Bdellovibrio sp.]
MARAVISLLILLFSLTGWTATRVLFRDGKAVYIYDELIREKRIKPGDVLVFSDGNQFTVTDYLGKGTTSQIYAVDDGKHALRIPLSQAHQDYIKYFVTGAFELEKNKVPMVTVYHERRLSPQYYEYAVMERLHNFMEFHDFVQILSSSRMAKMVNKIVKKKEIPIEEMIEKFYVFVAKIAVYSQVGDLHIGNLIYDFEKGEWRMMDWTDEHKKAYVVNDAQIYFSNFESPLRKLFGAYGTMSGFNFYPNKTYMALEEIAQKAHAIILQKRQVIIRSGLCEMAL